MSFPRQPHHHTQYIILLIYLFIFVNFKFKTKRKFQSQDHWEIWSVSLPVSLIFLPSSESKLFPVLQFLFSAYRGNENTDSGVKLLTLKVNSSQSLENSRTLPTPYHSSSWDPQNASDFSLEMVSSSFKVVISFLKIEFSSCSFSDSYLKCGEEKECYGMTVIWHLWEIFSSNFQ